MNIRFDFVIHWIFAIAWALLAISGFSMVGAKYGWILNFNFATADYVHRVSAAVFVVITFISVIYEVIRSVKNENKHLPWFVFGRSGYQLFVFITSLLLIITGALIWVCIEFNMAGVAFALLTHEYISYIALASVIWHIYKKCHALMWPKKPQQKTNDTK